MNVDPAEVQELLTFTRELAGKTRALIEARLKRGFTVKYKSDESEVTEVDREVEEFLRTQISKRYPEHSILGEELAAKQGAGELRWILDPIDGTQNFTRGIPTFGTIIAVHRGDEPLVGVVDHPMLGRCYSAAKGLGAYLNEQRITLSDLVDPAMARHELVTVSTPSNFARYGELTVLQNFLEAHQNIRVYGDCFSQTRAVEGQTGAAVHFNVNLWDIGAAEILVREAGGEFICARKLDRGNGVTTYTVILGKPAVTRYLLPYFS